MKRKSTTAGNLLQVRLRGWTVKDVESLATSTYGFRSKAEFVRALLEYVNDNRPELTKVYSPKPEAPAQPEPVTQ